MVIHVHDTVVILEEGYPPPTTVPPVRPAGLQEGAQWAPPGDQPMQNGSGMKTTATRGSGGRGSDGEGVPRLREEYAGGDGVLVSRESNDKHRRRLASGGRESQEGAGNLGEPDKDSGTGGGGGLRPTHFEDRRYTGRTT